MQQIPALSQAAPSITHQRDRHQLVTGVSILSAGWEPQVSILPQLQICRGKDCQAGAGRDPGRLLGLGRCSSPGLAITLPLQQSGATGSAQVGLVPWCVPLHHIHSVQLGS